MQRSILFRSIMYLLPLAFVTTTFAQSDLLSTLRVRVDREAKIKQGADVYARTMDDFFVNDELVVPGNTLVLGKIDRVVPVSRQGRLNAMSHGDFTPLHNPEITFSSLRLSDGREVPLSTDVATVSSETVRFVARGTKHASAFHRAWSMLMGRKDEAVKVVTAPGKKDRLEEYLYAQLPWHPQEIEDGTVFELHLRQPIAVSPMTERRVSQTKGISENAQLKARLVTPLDSRTAKNGDAVAAVVTSPEFDANHSVAIPQGSILYGRVVNARSARSFGRNGALRFAFEKLQLPEGFQQQVNGVTKGIDGARGHELAIDSEGGVKPPSNKSMIAPLALTLLSASALREDEAPMGHAAVSSNGFGLATRIVAIATKSNIFGGIVGGVAAGRMVYSRFLAHGKNVEFPRGTGIEVDLGTAHTPMPKTVP